MHRIIRTASLLVDAAIAAIVIGAIALAGLSLIGPRIDHSPIILRGNSMAPTAPVGSLVIIRSVEPADLATGDIVTVRTDRGSYVTHRVTRLVERPDGLYLETKGDNNATPDPQIFTATHVVGRAVAWVAGLGYVLDAASIPVLWFAIFGLLVSLYLAGSILDGLRVTSTNSRGNPATAAVPR